MNELMYPSAEAPASPGIRLTLAPDWVPVVAPGAVLAAVKRMPSDVFIPNLQVTVTRHPVSWSLEQEAESLDEGLAGLVGADVNVLDTPPAELPPDSDATCRLVAHQDPAAGSIVQVFFVIRVPQGPVADMVHCIGTVHRDTDPGDREEMKRIISSAIVSVDGATPSSGQDDQP